MRAAFFFDTFLIKKKNDYYGMTLTYDFFKKRYLRYYDEIIISTREKSDELESGNTNGYKITNGENVKVCTIKSYKNILDGILKKKKIKMEISSIIDKCDIAIIRLPSTIGSIACEVCKEKNKKYLIEVVACAWDGYINHYNYFGKVVAPYMFMKTRKSVKKAPRVLYVTKKFLQKRYPTLGEEIDCSDVIIEDTNSGILQKRIEKIKKDNNKYILCTVANVGLKYKGQEYVIRAIRELEKMGINNFEYHLIGNGNKDYLEKLIKKLNLNEKIKFIGSVNHNEVFNYLDNIDIYIQPSLQEGLPRGLLEAMSRGCPSIGSNAGGIPELLNKKNIFKRKDISQIVKILKEINKERLIEMAQENFELINKNYKLEYLMKKRNKFYLMENYFEKDSIDC